MNRRDLIQRVVLGGAVLIVSPSILQSCSKSPDPVPDPPKSNPLPQGSKLDIDLSIAANSALNSTGGSVIVQSIIVVNTGGGNFTALSSICTHQGCTVGYDSAVNNFVCPCHGSVFSQSGSVVNGPATSALKSYTISKTGNILSIAV